jgi:hypothetical protein
VVIWLLALVGCLREHYDPVCGCRWTQPAALIEDGEEGVPEFTMSTGEWMRIEPIDGSFASTQRLAEGRVPVTARPDPTLQATGVPVPAMVGGLAGARVEAVLDDPWGRREIFRVTVVQGRLRSWVIEERVPVERWASWRTLVDPMVLTMQLDARPRSWVTPAVLPGRGVVEGAPSVFAYGEGCAAVLPTPFSYDPALDAWVRPSPGAPVIVALATYVDEEYVYAQGGEDRGTSVFLDLDFAVVAPCLSGVGPDVVAHAERAVAGAAAATGGDPERVYVYADGPAAPLGAVVGARSTAHRAVVLAGGAPGLGRVTVDGADVPASEVARRPMLWLRPERGEGATVSSSGRMRAVTIPRDDGTAGLRRLLQDIGEQMRDDVGPMVALYPRDVALFQTGVDHLTLAMGTLDERVAPWLDAVVAVGLHSRSAILDEAAYVFDDVPPFAAHAAVSEQLGPALDAKRAAEATWPEVTDPERLTIAFGSLAALGWYTFEGTTTCDGCLPSEVTGSTPEGSSFVYYEWSAARSVVAGEPLQLAYGTVGGDPTAEQGQAIVQALRDAGLASSWVGDPMFRVPVTMTWQRRVPVDPIVEDLE